MDGKLLFGKDVLITASTSGIGLATAGRMAEAGVRAVVLNGRNVETGAAVVSKLRAQWPETQFHFVAADINNPEGVQMLFDAVRAYCGALDIMVHSGVAEIRPDLFMNIDPANFLPLITGHFLSLAYCCRQAIPMMMERGGGAIVSIASDAGKIATPAETMIGGGKAASIMFSRCLALEMSRHNIRVNCITPSVLRETKAHARIMAGGASQKVFEKAESRARLGVPVPDDIAPLAVFLASPLASKMTGQAISVNGGISAA